MEAHSQYIRQPNSIMLPRWLGTPGLATWLPQPRRSLICKKLKKCVMVVSILKEAHLWNMRKLYSISTGKPDPKGSGNPYQYVNNYSYVPQFLIFQTEAHLLDTRGQYSIRTL